MFENFPYSNFHDLNTDWLINRVKNVETSEANAKASEQAAAGSATAAAQSAQASAQSAQASAQSASASAQSAEASANSATEADNYVSATREQVNLLQSRVDNIVPSGTQTEGNTELLDIRVGYNGVTYPSAGDAVRGQVGDLKNAIIENESLVLDGLYKIYPINGYLNYAGRIIDDGETSYATSVIPCSEGDKFHYSGAFGGNSVACIFLNGNKVVDYVTKSSYNQTEIDITVPSGVNAIRFGGYHTKQEIYKKGNLFDIIRNVGLSPLDGSKIWYAFGDSFTHGDFTGYVDANGHSGTESDAYDPNFYGGMYKTWAYWIAKRHKMRLTNLAVNGAKTTYLTEDNRYAYVPSNCDYVTFMLGLNDTQSDDDIDSTDPKTWHGAWNVTLAWLRANRPHTKIGIIIPPSWLGNSWRVEIEAVATRHGVSVLNLYSDPKAPALLGTLNGTLLAKKDMDSTISARVTANNVVKSIEPVNEHPNLACFEQMSHIIEEFMQGL